MWTIHKQFPGEIVGDGGERIALACGPDYRTNAPLLAAAPRLRDTLAELVKAIETGGPVSDHLWPAYAAASDLLIELEE